MALVCKNLIQNGECQVQFDRYSYPFSLVPGLQDAFEAYMSSPRFLGYLNLASGDRSQAFRLYRWNSQLCESLYIPAQFVEIGLRNCVVAALDHRFGTDWATTPDSIQSLPRGAKQKITEAIQKIRTRKKTPTKDRVVAELSFGFWCRLFDRPYRDVLWVGGAGRCFPNLPPGMSIEQVRDALIRIRDFRNRIAHYEQVITYRPAAHYNLILDVIGWIDGDIRHLVAAMCDFTAVNMARPR